MDDDESRWRPPSFLFIPLILCGGFICYIDIFQLQTFKISTETIQLPQPRFVGHTEDENLKGFLIKTEGCRIPDMNPLDSSVAQYIFREKPIVCNNNTPPLIESNLTSLYLLRSALLSYGISDISALKCCYSNFKRVVPSSKDADNKVSFNSKCVPFNISVTVSEEFVQVKCSYNGSNIYKDFFSFVPIKAKLVDKSVKKSKYPMLNVLVIGLDAVSRLNLHRQMPKTVQILQDLNAVEFLGYNKVADNTFPNLIPVLTGLSEKELTQNCWKTKNDKFDKCPFVWKKYNEGKFATVFGEDAAWMGIFNYLKKGFKNQPTDYFWDAFDYTAERQIGNKHDMNVYQCIGAKLVYKSLLEYIDKFANTMHINRIPYFGFFWGSSISHDYLNKPHLADNDYAKFFNRLRVNGTLKNTALVFMSDHGIRWGDIRTTYQGRMEERLPFLFIALPKQFREDFYMTYVNLKVNARRLTTPFDLHETLVDLVNPYGLSKEILFKRSQSNQNKRGYSLFTTIPGNRTCENAGISPHWCTCQKSTSVSIKDTIVLKAAAFSVQYINEQLIGYADCAKLSLAEIYNARVHSSADQLLGNKHYSRDYTIAFRTSPGDATFEATVRQHLSKKSKSFYFNITGTISRINLYGRQSLCVTDFHLKLYCYCKT